MHTLIIVTASVAGALVAITVWVLASNLRRRNWSYIAFAVLTFCVAVDLYATAATALVTQQRMALPLLQTRLAITCAIFFAAVWFFGQYANLKLRKRWVVAFGTAYALAVLIIAFAPEYVLSDVKLLKLSTHGMPTVALYFQGLWPYEVIRSLHYAVFLFGFGCTAWLWKVGQRSKAIPMSVFVVTELVVFFLANYYIGLLLYAQVNVIMLVVIMGLALLADSRRRDLNYARTLDTLDAVRGKQAGIKKQLRYIAHHDALTDLPNQQGLREILARVVDANTATRSYAALLLVAVENVTELNATYGRPLADLVLKAVLKRIEESVGISHYIARTGDSEFSILLPKLGPESKEASRSAQHCAENLVSSLNDVVRIGDHEFNLSLRVGIAVHGKELNEDCLIRHADTALDGIKHDGRRIGFFNPATEQETKRRLELARVLRHAFEHKELLLYYQPQLDNEGKFLGAEATLRWRDPARGLIGAEQILPVIMQSGLIHPVGEWVRTEICLQLVSIAKLGFAFPAQLSVKISPAELRSTKFVRQTLASIAQSRIDPRQLTLVLPGSPLSERPDYPSLLAPLVRAGVRLSVEGFGYLIPGYTQLRALGISEVKLDPRVTLDTALVAQTNLIQSILGSAQQMGWRAVAVDIQTQEQRRALLQMGCRAFQGTAICRPVTMESLEEWWRPASSEVIEQSNVLPIPLPSH